MSDDPARKDKLTHIRAQWYVWVGYRHKSACANEMESRSWTAAALKQADVGAKVYPCRSLCAGELHASRLAAGNLCVTHYLSIEQHKDGAHLPIRAWSLPVPVFTLSWSQGHGPRAETTPGVFIAQQPIGDCDLGHGIRLNKAVSGTSLHSLNVWVVTLAALCLREEMSRAAPIDNHWFEFFHYMCPQSVPLSSFTAPAVCSPLN